MKRRIWMTAIIAILVVTGIGLSSLPTEPLEDYIPPNNPIEQEFTYPINETRLDEFAANLQSGGVPVDGIPPIENPNYWDVDKADDYLDDSDFVFGFVHNGEYYAFPQRILVWHEIVNIVIDGEQFSITYCPLTGSSLAFRGDIETANTTLGVSGRLLNSNLVMYDRNSSSYWPQIFSQSISGASKGVRLQRLHVSWTRWGVWKTAFPDSLVLSTSTGFTRNYQYDPYGSYNNTNSYYYKGNPYFPVMHEDHRLPDKRVVIGIDVYDAQHAVEKQYLREFRVLNLDVGNESVAVFYDEVLDDVRVFNSNLNGTNYTFTYMSGGFYDQDGGVWSRYGTSMHGALTPVDSFDVMWFAWSAFYPNTGLTCYECS
ncbi:MAG: DUF3179 domain-containing protein [Candidatus Thorarchaeota archaeon]